MSSDSSDGNMNLDFHARKFFMARISDSGPSSSSSSFGSLSDEDEEVLFEEIKKGQLAK